MPIQQTLNKGKVPVHIWTDEVESKALDQLANIAGLPFIHHHVAAMPDVHLGLGATVGSVIPTHKAIIPASVGVDIGCGMMAVKTTLHARELPDSLNRVRSAIEARVPVGFGMHGVERIPHAAAKQAGSGLETILSRHPKLAPQPNKGKAHRWARQIGTLGGGNHFIEICLDTAGDVWVMLHSGSRGIGNQIGQYFIARARELLLKRDVRLPDKDLAWFDEGTPLFDDYVEAVNWAQNYAAINREVMMKLVLEAMRRDLPDFEVTEQAINCHHNYVVRERHFGADVLVTRKGAIRAGEGELGIIPGSMGARSYIVRGKGNADSFCSCAHGAGRRMSRSEARRRFKSSDLEAQTRGVECRKDKGVLDEIPAAYKDIDQVMANQKDLVDVVAILKQVVCVKG
ncbi:MAG: RtcB family protein [Wenzhouxiangellaceae bacterium]